MIREIARGILTVAAANSMAAVFCVLWRCPEDVQKVCLPTLKFASRLIVGGLSYLVVERSLDDLP
ncbi:MAG: hypothetical protein ABII72_01825 [Parcubacteria group bacterium]